MRTPSIKEQVEAVEGFIKELKNLVKLIKQGKARFLQVSYDYGIEKIPNDVTGTYDLHYSGEKTFKLSFWVSQDK
jgi:hypothetical protein